MPQILALVGSAIIVISGFLDWVDGGGNAYDGPAMILFDSSPSDGGLKLGIVVLLLGAVCVLGVFLQPVRWLTLVGGALAIVVGLRFMQQINTLVEGSGQSLTDVIGIGVYGVIVGGVVAVVGGILGLRSSTA
jgi:hypothetical protein